MLLVNALLLQKLFESQLQEDNAELPNIRSKVGSVSLRDFRGSGNAITEGWLLVFVDLMQSWPTYCYIVLWLLVEKRVQSYIAMYYWQLVQLYQDINDLPHVLEELTVSWLILLTQDQGLQRFGMYEIRDCANTRLFLSSIDESLIDFT